MPKYTIKKGYEHLVFSEEGVRRLDDGTIDSDHELTNPHLVAVTATQPSEQTATATVAQPVVTPAAPAPVPAPAAQPQTQTPQEGTK